MTKANAVSGTTMYIDDNVDVPEDSFDPLGFPTTIRFVGPGASPVVDIDLDD